MRPTDILSAEHRVIEQVLDCLDKIASEGSGGDRFDAESARQAVDFLRHFADQCHHGKEEGHLFPLLETRGLPHYSGPTAVMRQEHEQGRRHLAAMAATIEPATTGKGERETFRAHAKAYTRLLRDHIRKEEDCLFTMAANLLDEGDCQALLRGFQGFEHHDMEEGAHQMYIELAHQLADRHGVGRSVVSGSCHCTGHAAS
jgi:hemerythrin-like domain-containing protein